MSWLHPDEFRALMKRQTTLAYKDDLTEEERAELGQLWETINPVCGHPLLMKYEELMALNLDEHPQWVTDLLHDKAWTWQWWATYLGMSIKEQVSHSDPPSLTDEAIAHIEAMPPYPPGWMPETRR